MTFSADLFIYYFVAPVCTVESINFDMYRHSVPQVRNKHNNNYYYIGGRAKRAPVPALPATSDWPQGVSRAQDWRDVWRLGGLPIVLRTTVFKTAPLLIANLPFLSKPTTLADSSYDSSVHQASIYNFDIDDLKIDFDFYVRVEPTTSTANPDSSSKAYGFTRNIRIASNRKQISQSCYPHIRSTYILQIKLKTTVVICNKTF